YIARRHMHHVRITPRPIVVASEPIGKADSLTIPVPEEKMGAVNGHNGTGKASDHNGNRADDSIIGNHKDVGRANGHEADQSALGTINRPLRVQSPHAYGQDMPLPISQKIASRSLPPMPPLVPKVPGQGLLIEYYPRKSLVAQKRAKRHRRIMLRHFSRKHLRQARVVERRARRRMWINIACAVLSFM